MVNGISVNFNHHENPILDNDEVWLDSFVIVPTFDENWQWCERNAEGFQCLI